MKKSIRFFWAVALFFSCFLFIFLSVSRADTSEATLSTDVQEYINFSISSNSTVSFGDLTPGTPAVAPATGTVASVTTSAENGYSLSISDGSNTNSSLRHTDATTYIADYDGTIETPTQWTDGVSKGVGITLIDADTDKEVKWGSGTDYDDANNKYAGIPASGTIIHTAASYHEGVDTSTWGFKVDVPNTQKTGSYSGNVTFTATGIL